MSFSNKFILFGTLLLVSILCGIAVAQSPSKILKNAEKALGEKRKVSAVNSVSKRGLVVRTVDGASGEFSVQSEKPQLYHAKFALRGFETEFGFNGKSAWFRDSREGLRTLTGSESESLQFEAEFRAWRWFDYKKRKDKIYFEGNTNLNGKPALIVALVSPNGLRIRLYFDSTNYLLLREEIPFGKEIQAFDYSDYRPINGVKEAFQIKTSLGGEDVILRIDQIEHNANVDASRFNFPNISNQPLPDIPNLLEQLRANEDRVEALLEDYSYTEKTLKRELDNDGKLRVTSNEINQISFYHGYRLERLISKDGRRLSDEEQKNEDKKVEKRVEEIDKELAKQAERNLKQGATGTPNAESRRISIAELLRASKLINPRREVFQDRNVIVFDFEPNPDFDYSNAKSLLKFFGKTTGAMWIDEEDKQVARIEAELAESFNVGGGLLAKLRKGASFMLEKKRFNDEIWLLSIADINLSVRVLLLKNISVNQRTEAYDYRRFQTEVKDATINNPPIN
ncbi:MAG: hypothetical protein ACK5NT_10525 [Pyrinomonadaceae bacterium]